MKSLLFAIFAISCGMFWVAPDIHWDTPMPPHALVRDPQWRENPSVVSFGVIAHEGSTYRLTGRWKIICVGDTPLQVAPGVRFCSNGSALEVTDDFEPATQVYFGGMAIIGTPPFHAAVKDR